MPPLYKQKSKQSEPPTQCKACGSHNTKRVHRTVFEKMICTLTSGRYAYQKYDCKACKASTFKSMDEAEKIRSVTLQGKPL